MTTIKIMELTAVIEALKSLTRQCEIVITTDSNYVKDGITEWIHIWKQKLTYRSLSIFELIAPVPRQKNC